MSDLLTMITPVQGLASRGVVFGLPPALLTVVVCGAHSMARTVAKMGQSAHHQDCNQEEVGRLTHSWKWLSEYQPHRIGD